MKMGEESSRLLRIAGFLLIAGLVVETVTLIWAHPITFMLYLGLGGLLTAAGIVFYFISLTRHQPPAG